MGRKVLLAVICWLAISEAEEVKTVNVSVTDNVSAESAPRLYQNIPVGVYASGAPYGSYSFHVPVVQHVAASQGAPKTAAVQNAGYLSSLKDSYGKYVQVPQSVYKMFPQHYLQLQELPAHLSQPLVAASPSVQYKQTAPHFYFGSQNYRVPSVHQAATPTPITRFTGPSQPLVYAENIRSFAPSSGFYSQVHNFPTSQQQSSSKNVHSSAPTPSYQQVQGISQAQVLSDNNKESKSKQQADSTHGKIQAAPAQTSVTAIVNGKKTVITLDTEPPVPLLDLDLLEPLTFANPLVPQVQHFLPRINQATYHKLPNFNLNNEKKRQKEIIAQKTKSYDSGHIKGKPQTSTPKKKILTKPRPQSAPAKPKVTVKGSPDGEEFSYEINTPNHKETYNEQVVSYNKETNMKPVEYTYNKHTEKKPVQYSFVHSSKEPLRIKHVEYESDPQNPKQLIFKFSPEQGEQNDEVQQPPAESDESDESDESEDDSPAPQPQREHHGSHETTPTHPHQHQEAPRYHHNSDTGHFAEPPSHQYHLTEQKNHHEKPSGHNQHHHEHQSHYGRSPSELHYYNEHRSHHSESPKYPQGNREHERHVESPRQSHSHNEHNGYQSESPRHPQSHIIHGHSGSPTHSQHNHNNHNSPHNESPKPHSNSHHEQSPRQIYHHNGKHEESPRQSHHLKPEHREEYHYAPNHEAHQPNVHSTPHYYAQPLTVTVQNAFQPITPEYEEDITILPTHEPHSAHIKVDPNQHVQLGPSTPYQNAQPSPAPQKFLPQQEHNVHYESHNSPPQRIREKSKHIIIKENDESPDEMHTHTEQLVAQMIEQDENNEEDFEKAYKESAYGFPAYEHSTDLEKDIYNPQKYGVPRYTEFKEHQTPFQQYEEEGDEFPRSARLTYKDESDKKKENYFLDYSVSKPESYTDRYKIKEDYYKTYKKYRPEKIFVQEHNDRKKEKQNEKYITAPSHPFVYPAAAIPKQQQFFAQYKVAPKRYEFTYPKGVSSDSTAHASRPYNKFRTHFVEPQFQYGFEPLSAPLVLDSELAAMASNNSPESEKPGTRKKIYKENWYIKKTSTTAGKPS